MRAYQENPRYLAATSNPDEWQQLVVVYERQEDFNQHGENCLMVAEFSKSRLAVVYAEAAQRLHGVLGHASQLVYALRITAYAHAFILIKEQHPHGEKIAEALGSGFMVFPTITYERKPKPC